jgi:hypothetical protein
MAQRTVVKFRYGRSAKLTGRGIKVKQASVLAPTSDGVVQVGYAPTGLSQGTKYYFRAIAINDHGKQKGPIRSFRTKR